MKKIFTLILFLVSTGLFAQATGDYRSFSSGTWATAANWERFNGSTWVNPAPSSPTSADGVVTILNGHTMTNAANGLSIDQLVIASGGQLTINSTVTWTLANGTGTDLDIQGTLLNQGGTWTVTGAAWTVSSGGTYIHNTTSGIATPLGAATFNSNSTMIFRGSSSLAVAVSVSNRTFGHCTFESTSGALAISWTGGSALTVNGNLTIGSNVTVTNSMTGTNVFAGDFTNNGTLTNSTGTQQYSFTGVSKTISGSGAIAFETMSNSSSASTILGSNVSVASTFTATINGTLICGTNVFSGAGAFTLAATGTLKSGNTTGIDGSITVSGTKTLNNTGSSFEFNGTGTQSTGTSLPTAVTGSLTFSNSGGVTTLSQSTSNTGTTTVGSGAIVDIASFNLTGSGGSSVLAGTGTIRLAGVLSTQITGYNSNTFQTAGTYVFNSGASQNIPSGTYAGITINGGGATMLGDLTVTGTLALNGTLTVGANTLTISNPITVTPANLTTSSSSSLIVNGTAASISIPSSVTALTNLTINNNQVVTAAANITVSGTFTLGGSSFVLDMGANTLEIGTSTAVLGTLTRTTSGSVRGIIKRWLSTGTSTLLFPLNNNSTDYVGATVNFSVNPSSGGSLTARYTSTGSGLFPLGPNGIDRYIDFGAQYSGMNLINLSPQFWTISDADGLAGFTYGLSLEANNMGVNTSGNNYQYTAVVKRNTGGGNTWAWSNSNHVTTGGNGSNPVPQCQGYTSFSDFAIGGNVDNLLPVELSSFTSAIDGRDLILNWSTGTETNNSGFDIERKSTTGGWSKIGNVAGHGTVNTPNSYTYTDRNLSSGKYNYRLKQIDFNGNYKYYNLSNEVIIGTPSKYALTQNFPNPFNPSTSISYEIPATNFVSLKIYDMMGKEVANLVNGTQEAGFYTVKFDASKLASGVYFYKLQANDFTATKKLMLMK